MARQTKIATSRPLSLTIGAVAALCVLGITLWAPRAEAGHLFEFYLDGYGGGMYGTPQIAGFPHPPPANSDDFFHDQSGGLLGGKVGIELLYTDLYLQFDQFFNSTGAAGSDLQLMLGWDLELGPPGPKGLKGVLGIYGGPVFGFPYTPHFPIDKTQIATFGVAAELQGGVEYHFNRFLLLQALGTVGYHYMFRPLDGVNVDNSGNADVTTSHGFHLLAKVGLRFHVYAL